MKNAFAFTLQKLWYRHTYTLWGAYRSNLIAATIFRRLQDLFFAVGVALLSFGSDWQANPLLNPLWHPHARYHAVILLIFWAGIADVACFG